MEKVSRNLGSFITGMSIDKKCEVSINLIEKGIKFEII